MVFAFSTSDLRQIRDREPEFSEIVHVVFRNEKMGWNEVRTLRKKMKLAPWLPQLYIGYDKSIRDVQSISITDNISVTSQGVVVGPNDSDFDQSLNNADAIRLRAVWNLDETIYHPDRLALIRYEQDLSKTRLQLGQQVFQLYSKRREAQVAYLRSHATDKSLLLEKILLLTDQLDALTNGVFVGRWWRAP